MHHGFEVRGIGDHTSSLWGYLLPLPNKCVLLVSAFLQLQCYNICVYTASLRVKLKFSVQRCVWYIAVSVRYIICTRCNTCDVCAHAQWLFLFTVYDLCSLCYRSKGSKFVRFIVGSKFVRYKVSYICSSLLFVCVASEHEGN